MNEINMPAISGYLHEHRDEMIADLRAFVGRETPSEDKGLLDAFADYLAEYSMSERASLICGLLARL